MALSDIDKNRQYVDDMFTRLTHASDDCCLFLEPVSYKPGDTINFIGFLLLNEKRQPLNIVGVDEMISIIKDDEGDERYPGMTSYAMGVTGAEIQEIDHHSVSSIGWQGGNRYFRERAYTSTDYHNFDDVVQYAWYSFDETGNKVYMHELSYCLYRILQFPHVLAHFIEVSLKAIIDMCQYNESERVVLYQRLERIMKNFAQRGPAVAH